MYRTVVITGAASGIGKAAYALLKEQGHRVIGVDLRNTDIAADLSTEAGRAAMIEAVRAESGGRVDAVVACAGLASAEPITVSVNYFGAVATLSGLRPLLAEGNDPRAVLISSLAATMPFDQALVDACLAGDEAAALQAAEGKANAIYASTKVAVLRWARQQAITPDWAGKGILLNIVAPGLIETPMTQAMIDDAERLKYLRELMPMPVGRYGQPQEVGKLIAFLCSPDLSFMVGQVLFIDGGSEATTRGDMAW